MRPFLFIVLLVSVVGACGYQGYAPTPSTKKVKTDPQTKGGGKSEEKPDPITWAEVDAQVFSPRCIVCHGTLGGYSLETYQQTMDNVVAGDADQSILCQRVRDGSMPPGSGLEQELIDLICDWIEQGAVE